MKKVFLLFISLCCASLLWAQVSKTVNVGVAGTLSTVLTATEQSTITDLTVTGAIDEKDFATMKKMPLLANLKLGAATIVAGGVYGANIIPSNAFQSKTSLLSVVLPASATSINEYAFDGCKALTSVTIPRTINTIGDYAFNGCISLSTIYCYLATNLTNVGKGTFASVSSCTLYVPAGTVNTIKKYNPWSNFSTFKEMDVSTANVNNALAFDGLDDYVSVSESIDDKLTAFTIEAWVKPAAGDQSGTPFVCGKAYEQMEIHLTSKTNSLRFIPTPGVFLDAPAGSVPFDVWTHIAASYDPINKIAKIWINGVLVVSNSYSTPLANNSTLFNIGRRSSCCLFKGAIDELRVWNTVRSDAEIQENMYKSTNTFGSTNAALVAGYSFDQGIAYGANTFVTSLASNNGAVNGTLTYFALTGGASNFVTGVQVAQGVEPNNALNFKQGDYIATPDNDDAIVASQAMTIEGWVKWQPTNGDNTKIDFICGKEVGKMELHTGGNANANGLRFIPTDGGVAKGVFIDVANVLPIGVWTHVAAVYDAKNAIGKIYINGVDANAKITTTYTNTPINASTLNFNIGRRGDNTYFFNGSMDEFRVWSVARTAAQIKYDMTRRLTDTVGLVQSFDFNRGIAGADNTSDKDSIYNIAGKGLHGKLNNFSRSGKTSNWIESYAKVFPIATAPSSIGSTSFTANWTAPAIGKADSYLLYLSSDNTFNTLVSGYPKLVTGTSASITGLTRGTQYYYRVRAVKTGVDTSTFSNSTKVPFILNVSSTSLTIGSTINSTQTVTITSNAIPTVSSNVTWLGVSLVGDVITFTAKETNPTVTSRGATVTVSVSGLQSQTISVTQAASDAALAVSTNSFAPAKDGGIVTVTVTSNTSWSVANTNSAAWINLDKTSGSNNGALTITALENPTSSPRTATVTLTTTLGASTKTQTITVTQAANNATLTVPTPDKLDSTASNNKSVDVTTNAPLTVKSSESWLTVSSIANKLTFTATRNTSIVERSATVSVTATGAIDAKTISITVTQAATKPYLTATPNPGNLPNQKGTTSIAVQSNTTWTSSSDNAWLTLTNATATGNGNITYSYTQNKTTEKRNATITLTASGLSQTIAITQAAGDTTLNISANTVDLGKLTNSNGTANLTSNTSWTVTGIKDWLQVSPETGTGDASLSFTAISNNPSVTERVATLSILASSTKKQSLVVRQAAGDTVFQVQSSSLNFGLAAETKKILVTANVDWTILPTEPWLTPTKDKDTLILTVGTNPETGSRNQTITLTAGKRTITILVSQAGANATLTISSESVTLKKTADSAIITVNANTTWKIIEPTDASWLTVDSLPATGNNGSIKFVVDTNLTTSVRIAKLIITPAGGTDKPIIISQAAGDAFIKIAERIKAIDSSENNVSIYLSSNVKARVSCTNNWITGLNSDSVAIDGTISFTAEANTTIAARTATITVSANGIASQTITVNQAAGAATLSVDSESYSMIAAGETKTATVTSNTTWTAKSNANWLTAKKDFPDILSFTASANEEVSERTAKVTLSAAGADTVIITLTQAAGGTTLTVDTDSIHATQWASSNDVAINSNVEWKASSLAKWFTFDSSDASLTVIIAANDTTVARKDSIKITTTDAKQSRTIIVTQVAAEPVLSVTQTDVYFANSLSRSAILISSNTAWAATSGDQAWLSATKKGDSLIISASANAKMISRSDSIFVVAGTLRDTIIVSQEASEASVVLDETSVSTSESITVTANTEWSVSVTSENSEWLKVDTANNTISFTATANPTITARTATITISATGVVPQTVEVTQAAGAATLSLSKNTVTAAKTITTLDLTVTSNTAWTLQSDAAWLTSNKLSGTGTVKCTLTATANTSIVDRTATITVSAVGAQDQKYVLTQAAGDVTLSVTPKKLFTYNAATRSDSVSVTSNTSWSASKKADWITITPKAKFLVFTLAANTSNQKRTDYIIVTAGSLKDSFLVTQTEIITVTKQADISVQRDSVLPVYLFSKYFSYSKAMVYKITSSNQKVVRPSATESDFGLSIYGLGTTTLTVTATATDGTTATMSFNMTVTGLATACKLTVQAKTITPVNCAGKSTGAITLSVENGLAPYRYKWSNTSSSDTLVGVKAGTYTVVVSDSLNCSASQIIEIPEVTAMQIDTNLVSPDCAKQNGSIRLSVSGGTAPYKYKWSNDSTRTMVQNIAAGVYTVSVSDKNYCVSTQTIALSNNTNLSVKIDTTTKSQCNNPVGIIQVSVKGGREPYTFKWSDDTIYQNRTKLKPGNYQLTVSDVAGCLANVSTRIEAISFAQPRIALVTVSQKAGNFGDNLVVWKKEKTSAIKYYTIYREMSKAKYDSVGTVPYDSLSVFADKGTNNQEESFRYKISATDYCGKKSELSTEHKTMLLRQTRSLDNAVQLTWDAYEGLEFGTYSIYRNNKTTKTVEMIKQISASNESFNDTKAPKESIRYFVAIDLRDTITLNALKSDTGPFSQSFSNMSEANLVSLPQQITKEPKESMEVNLMPNPTKNLVKVQITSTETAQIVVTDLLGHQLLSTQGIGIVPVDCSTFAPGMYLITVNIKDSTTTRRLMIER